MDEIGAQNTEPLLAVIRAQVEFLLAMFALLLSNSSFW